MVFFAFSGWDRNIFLQVSRGFGGGKFQKFANDVLRWLCFPSADIFKGSLAEKLPIYERHPSKVK